MCCRFNEQCNNMEERIRRGLDDKMATTDIVENCLYVIAVTSVAIRSSEYKSCY